MFIASVFTLKINCIITKENALLFTLEFILSDILKRPGCADHK